MAANMLATRPSRTLAGALVRIRAEQYHLMIEQGIIPEDSTTELLNGLIIKKDRSVLGEDQMGHSPLHCVVVALISALASRINGPKRHLRIQLPLAISDAHEPEPDGSIVRGAVREYIVRLPSASEAYCVIEAAHSSLERDRDDKLPVYAGAGIPQYIIVNLPADCLEIHTEPDTVSATYRTKTTAGRGQVVRLNLGDGESMDIQAEELLP
jgi:hypothetical protein